MSAPGAAPPARRGRYSGSITGAGEVIGTVRSSRARNRPAVPTGFGRYTGTVRLSGLQWVNPFTTRRKISTRIRNHETPVLKVNDADGNSADAGHPWK
jgi:regulator of protease activity HflC (stomatin/prohibitin superfamily)